MRKKKTRKFNIKDCIGDREFNDEFHMWNFILKQQSMEAIKPGKSSIVEQQQQIKSKKSGLPKWAKGVYR